MIFYDRKVGKRPTTILLLAIKVVDLASQILVVYRDWKGKCKGKLSFWGLITEFFVFSFLNVIKD
jgi:hypothetical protein